MGEVMIGVDGSVPSRQALKWAAAVAGARGVALRAVTAWQYPSSAGTPLGRSDLLGPDRMDEAAREELEKILADELGPASEAVAIEIGRGTAGSWLVERAAAGNVGMLVLGARGLGGFEGMLLGSVSQQCVENARCPIVVIRGGDVAATTTVPSTIVVGLDGSDGSQRALAWTLELATDINAEVVAAHAPGPGASPAVLREAGKVLQQSWCEPIRACGVRHTSHVDAGDPRTALMRVADDVGAGLTVVGTRGLGPVRALLLGGVASYLVRHATRPIAVIPRTPLAD